MIIQKEIEKIILNKFNIPKNKNKFSQLKRLIFEILIRENISLNEFMNLKEIKTYFNKELYGNDKFEHLKTILLKLRFPSIKNIKDYNFFLNPLPEKINKSNNFFDIKKQKIKKIYIEKKIKNSLFVNYFIENSQCCNIFYVDNAKELRSIEPLNLTSCGKDIIFLCEQKFDIHQKCPCTSNALCCQYYIFNLGFGCPYDCTYCYLQHYNNFPAIILPVNVDECLDKLIPVIKNKILRIGTGEFTDSLCFDDLTKYSIKTVAFFNKFKNIVFELKTKSNNINNLLKIKPSKNIVISWSINPEKIVDNEERGTASLEERLNSALKCLEYGYSISFHFDPIIPYKNWETDYLYLCEKLISLFKNKIAWISLGILRFHRSLKKIAEARFGPGKIQYYYDQFIIDPYDKKMRYPDFIRQEIFSKIINKLKSLDKDLPIYLCMENISMFKKLLPEVINKKNINKYIISRIIK